VNIADKVSDPTGYASRDDLMRQLLTPNHIAIIGASPRPTSAGFMLLQNLNIFGFRGKVSLINSKYQAIGDRTCIPTVTEMTQPPELCVVALPAARAIAAVEDAMRAGVKTFVLFAGGFAERASRIYVRIMELCCAVPIHSVMLLSKNRSPPLSRLCGYTRSERSERSR
jgi:acyl-CoA synthetase (NDP forming)